MHLMKGPEESNEVSVAGLFTGGGIDHNQNEKTFVSEHKQGKHKERILKHIKEPLFNFGTVVFDSVSSETPQNYGFESFFDLTPTRLKIIFEAIQKQSAASSYVVEFEALRQGLINCGVKEEDFLQLLKQVNKEADGNQLSFEEFLSVLQSLKMSCLLKLCSIQETEDALVSKAKEDRYEKPSIRVLDYHVNKVIARSPLDHTSLVAFLYGARPPWAVTRWIDVTTPADVVIKGLAIKYQFHPLALEDIFEGSSQAKYRKYDTHLFLEFPGMIVKSRVSPPQKSSFWRRKGAKFETLHRLSSSFYQQSSDRYSVDDENLNLLKPEVTYFNVYLFVTTPDLNTVISIVDKDAGGDEVFSRVRKELQVKYSRLRTTNGLFLLYTILDVIVDGYMPVLNSFEQYIKQLRADIHHNDPKFFTTNDSHSNFLQLYHDIIQELSSMKRRFKQALRILEHLFEQSQEIQVDVQFKVYMQDVLDHTSECFQRLETMIEEGYSLEDEHIQTTNSKFSVALAIMTIVSTIFLPGQFLSSVFGMNFHVSLLQWENGYTMFCLVVLISWIVMWRLFKKLRIL